MRWIKETTVRVMEWFDRNFTFKGLLVALWAALTTIPDAFGRKEFWSSHLVSIWSFIYAHSTMSTIMVCALLIWLDNRRVIAKRGPKPHDAKTVRGRILRLRDDLQGLLDESVSKWPEHVQGKVLEPYDHSAMENSLHRSTFILHTFALKFGSRATEVYHECALAGTPNDSFGSKLDQPIVSPSKLRELIGDLDWMAKHVD